MEYYLRELKSMKKFCEKFRRKVIEWTFTDEKTKRARSKPAFDLYCYTPIYQGYWKILYGVTYICEMLGIKLLEDNKEEMMRRIVFLNSPDSIKGRADFEWYLDFVESAFQQAEKKIKEKLQLLEEEEMHRLNEAVNCYIQGCNYAAVAMSVSAIEFRLLSLMQSVKSNPDLEKYTLGQLIDEYLQNKKEYKNIIPKKHEPLLNLCNTYRIFSVHPKKEKITRPIATSIINMTFTFLLDKKLKHKAETK